MAEGKERKRSEDDAKKTTRRHGGEGDIRRCGVRDARETIVVSTLGKPGASNIHVAKHPRSRV